MLKVENLSYAYSQDFKLGPIDFNLDKAEILSVLGKSGSGKSTLLSLIKGLKDADSGLIKLGLETVKGPAFNLVPGHKDIKLMTQQNSLFPNISIDENIAYEIRAYSKEFQKERVYYLAKNLGLEQQLNKLPRELSGGEIQRVMLGKALADSPKILLLDEPFANLDKKSKYKAITLLQKVLKKDKISCIWVTHELEDAYAFSDRIMLMEHGKVLSIAPPLDLYLKPKNQKVAALSGDYFLWQDEKTGKSRIIRPNQIRIVDSNTEEAIEVTFSHQVFRGNYFEIHFEYKNKMYFFYSFSNFQKNRLYLKID
jgi:ABC-type sugar transport system ATPase subunit